jgi:hypothetical protein
MTSLAGYGRKTLALAITALVLAGCGGGPLDSGDATDRIQAWDKIACGGAHVRTYTGQRLAAQGMGSSDIALRGVCERTDMNGTTSERQQVMTIYSSESALKTYLSDVDCSSAIRVNGADWVATTRVEEIATDLVDKGGELTC